MMMMMMMIIIIISQTDRQTDSIATRTINCVAMKNRKTSTKRFVGIVLPVWYQGVITMEEVRVTLTL
jgi:hypothetical protein